MAGLPGKSRLKMLRAEQAYWEEYPRILGMDEAGRGPICGPVVIAGVIFPPGYENEEINDSKKLSEKKRNRLFEQIQQDALSYWILFVSEERIDRLNIYRATQQGMETIAHLAHADFILSDAMPLPSFANHEAIVKGDSKAISIAAASILAKVARDRYMMRLDEQYPMYGLKDHKGYPTRKHLAALEEFGTQSFYRRSFGPVARKLEEENRLRLF